MIANALTVPSSNPLKGVVVFQSAPFKNHPVVISSLHLKDDFSRWGYLSFTASGIQGQTTPVVQFLVDRTMLTIMDRQQLITALCRTTETVVFIPHGVSEAEIRGHQIFGAVIQHHDGNATSSIDYWSLSQRHLDGLSRLNHASIATVRTLRARNMRQETAATIIAAGSRGRKKRAFCVSREVGSSADLDIVDPRDKMGMRMAALYDCTPLPRPEYDPVAVDTFISEKLDVHTIIPDYDFDMLLARMPVRLMDRYSREFTNEAGMSACYSDLEVPPLESAQFPRQRGNDPAFIVATIAARLQKSTIAANRADFAIRSSTGRALFYAGHSALGLPAIAPFDVQLFDDCLIDAMHKRVAFSQGKMDELDDRSDAWCRPFDAFVRVKGQLKVKLEAHLLEIPKAGQTINLMPEWTIAYFSAWVRYHIAYVKKYKQNGHVIIQHGQTLAEFDAEVKSGWQQEPGLDYSRTTINDFSKFGATQRGDSLAMDLAWFAWLGMPEWLQELYRELKISTRTKGFVKAISRDDGEANTYNGNTFVDLGAVALRFGVRALFRGCWRFAGDDMAADHHVLTCPSWKKWASRLLLICKVSHPVVADFCGWLLYKDFGIVRSPAAIFYKIWIRQAHGYKFEDFGGAYAVEMLYSYRAVRAGLWLDDMDMALLKYLVTVFHNRLPVLSTVLYCASDPRLRLEAMIASYSLRATRLGSLRTARKALDRMDH